MESTPYITLIRDVTPSVLFEGTNILIAGEKITAFPTDKQAGVSQHRFYGDVRVFLNLA